MFEADIFPTLYAKTFTILSLQLFITWAVTTLFIQQVARMYRAKVPGVTATTNADGSVDLAMDRSLIERYFLGLIIADSVVFLALLLIGQFYLAVGLPLFSIWSVLTGILLGVVLIEGDENLGAKVLAITSTVTVACALVGIFSHIDFGPMQSYLLILLGLVVVGNITRLVVSISRTKRRLQALTGILVFTGYLLLDFSHLASLNGRATANTWSVATGLAIDIYLDIINLFLEIMKLLSDQN
jgi:FtsH-binding integral membrane protein